MSDLKIFTYIAIISAVTMFLRFIPFIIWKKSKTPEVILYLGKYLPYSIMAMLVVYCFKNVSIKEFSHSFPELIAAFLVAFSYILKRNTLLSICLGTACCMILHHVL